MGGLAESDIPIIRPLGHLIIRLSENFTTCLQPMDLKDGELVYGITSYGSDEVLIVRDDDDLPFFDTTGMGDDDPLVDFSLLPPGLLKAAALETSIHLENVEKLQLEYEDSKTHKYFPKLPVTLRRRAWLKRKLSQTSFGRLCLRIFTFFNF